MMMNSFSMKSAVLTGLLVATAAFAQDQVVLKTQLPPPLFVGTPVPLNVPNLEPPSKGKRPTFGSRRHRQPGQKQEGHLERQQSRRWNAGHDRSMATRTATKAHGWN
jgi:hypothetical protein